MPLALFEIALGEGLAGRVAQSGEALLISDYSSWEGRLPIPNMNGRTLGVPLKQGEQVIGVLEVEDVDEPGTFDEAEVQLLSMFANQAAGAIENARLFEAEQEQRALAEALRETAETLSQSLELHEVLDRILASAQRIIPHDASDIALVTADGRLVIARHRGFEEHGLADWMSQWSYSPTETPITEKITQSETSVIVPDTRTHDLWVEVLEMDWVRSFMAMPIRVRDEFVGTINLLSSVPHHFLPEHGLPLQAFANQVAVAIGNARLFEAEQEQRALAEALRETAETLSQSLDLSEVLDHILSSAQRVIPHDASHITLFEDDSRLAVARHRGFEERGLADWMSQWRFSLAEFPTLNTAAQMETPLIISDTHNHDLWTKVPDMSWIGSFMTMPIRVQGEFVGSISLLSSVPHQFLPEHGPLLQAFASQAAVAIENARLFEAEHEQRALAEALRETAETLSQSLDLNEVLDHILASAQHVIMHDASDIALGEDDDRLAVARHRGFEERGLADWISQWRFTVADTPTSKKMAQRKTPLIISDTRNHDSWVEVPELDWVRSFMAMPIRVRDEFVGTINLLSSVPHHFLPEHRVPLQAFANQAAVAIGNARLFEELHASEARFRGLVNTAPDAIVSVDAWGHIVLANAQTEKMFGYPKDELQGQPIEMLLPERFHQIHVGHRDKYIADPHTRPMGSDLDLAGRCKDGSEFPVEISLSPLETTDGVLVTSIIRDVTKRKQAEEELRKSQALYNQAEHRGKSGHWEWDHINGRMVSCSDQLARNYEMSVDEALAYFSSWEAEIDIIHPDDRARYEQHIDDSEEQREGADFEFRIITRSGTVRHIYLRSEFVLDDQNRIIKSFGTEQDITERKLGEEALRASEENLRITLDSIGDAVIATDTQGNITSMNPVAESLTGWTLAEAQGKALTEVVKIVNANPKEPAFNPVEKVFESGKMIGLGNDTVLIAKDGTAYQIAESAAPIKGSSGDIEGVVLVFRVLTQEYQMRAQLRQQQKLESIGTLAGGVAHEINNPINVIMNYGQLISDRLDPESPLQEFAEGIGQETERVAQIVRNLLAFARHEKQSHSPANIADIVNDTISLISTIIRRDQITLQVDVPDDLPKFEGRSQQIQQVLMNLLTNARDALNERYPEYDPDKRIALTVRLCEKEGRRWLRTTVENHGAGIPDEIGERIFEPFFTTKDRTKGTGLGLSISHGIVQDHHGELSFESVRDQYTRFYLDLPVDNGWSLDEASEE